MPQRKNNPLGLAERQQSFRERRAKSGMIRREYHLPPEVVDDEELIKASMGVERVRELIAGIFAQQVSRLQKQEGGSLERPRAARSRASTETVRREYYLPAQVIEHEETIKLRMGVDHVRELIGRIFAKQCEEIRQRDRLRGKETNGNKAQASP